MNITVLDGFGLNPGDLSWDAFKDMGNLTVYDRTSPELVLERAKESEILLTNKTVLDAETISRLPRLRYIGVLATGYNVVDIDAARKRGVVVTNIPSYSTMSVAQRVFSLLLAVTDRTEHYAVANKEGVWATSKDFCWWDTQLTELTGKNFGIIGYGNIGKAVSNIAQAFGMNVLLHTSKPESGLPEGMKKVDLASLFKESDVISLHCPLTPETSHMINSTTIGEMKSGVILINTGRGPLVDEGAVAEALNSGKIRAYCADVLSTEPPSGGNQLLNISNTYITPHIAWATLEARTRLMDLAVNNLRHFLEGTPVNVVC